MNMNMDMFPYPHDLNDDSAFFYVSLCGTRMRVYYVYSYPIASTHIHPHIFTQSLLFYRPLPYPYTWYVFAHEAVVAIVNINDLHAHQQYSPSNFSNYSSEAIHETTATPSYYSSEALNEAARYYYHYSSESVDEAAMPYNHYSSESVDETAILEDLNMNQINESFEQASDFVACSGLTNKLISKNLTVTEYDGEEEEEESEVCVVCQVEFEKNERVGVLQCRHRFHPHCIKEWLLHKNLCPLCKVQALKI